MSQHRGTRNDFETVACQSFPVLQTIGSTVSDASFVAELSVLQEPGCVRLIFEFRSSPDTPFSLLPTQLAPELNVASRPTQTEISLPAGFEPGPFDNLPEASNILAAPDDADLPSAWTPFVVSVDTTSWFGASHAILVGDEGTGGFLGSGQIVQITDTTVTCMTSTTSCRLRS